jgi:N-acetylmuramoyl-L-alanine amidase
MLKIFLAAACLLLPLSAHARCDREDFVLAIDIGHSVRDPGAISSRGVAEYYYNKVLAARLLSTARRIGYRRAFIVNPDDQVLTLTQRAWVAKKSDADLLLSIHHDSMEARHLSQWRFHGVSMRYGDQYRGHSVFYSEKNPDAEESRRFAVLLGDEMRRLGLTPTQHHDGVGQRRLVDRDYGIYRYDPLILLKSARMPAVLFEAGVILNRDEELDLASAEYQEQQAGAILRAVERYCAQE